MEVIVAKTAGFCFGVKRAVEQVYEQIEKAERPVYTFGPIIHNEQVVEDLAQKGVRVIDTEEELETVRDAIVIIRSHGVGKHIYDLLERNGVTVVDATCPFVKKSTGLSRSSRRRAGGSSLWGILIIRRYRGSGDGEMRALWW